VPQLSLFVVGRDRPGIVAAVAERLLAHDVNIEDSRSANLRGHFAMMLLLSAPPEVDGEALASELLALAERIGLEWVWLTEVGDFASETPAPTHVVTVYGADHPGIVHAATSALAARGVNIADLQTRLLGTDEAPAYVMVLEVVAPRDVDVPELDRLLSAVAAAQGVEVSVRPFDPDPL
jgi:glycine cleavage system transcriptional repressor